MKRVLSILAIGLGAGLVFAVGSGIGHAQVKYERVSALVCQRQSDHDWVYEYSNTGTWLENNDPNNNRSYACPFPNSSDLAVNEMKTAKVDVYDGSSNDNIGIRICSYACTSGGCDADCSETLASTSGTGPDTLEPGIPHTGSNEFNDGTTVYLRVYLPADDGSDPSRVNSIYVSNETPPE